MGEARNRGPLEARVESAIKSRDLRLESLRETLGIPDSVKFGGYLVKIDDRDDGFLGHSNNGSRVYVGSPEQAIQFRTFDEANAQVQVEQGEVVVALFDFGAKLVVANVPADVTPSLN